MLSRQSFKCRVQLLLKLKFSFKNRNLITGTSTTLRAIQAFVAILTNHPELQIRLQAEVDTAAGNTPRLSDKHKMPLIEAVVTSHLNFSYFDKHLSLHASCKDGFLWVSLHLESYAVCCIITDFS